jgi:DNA-binding LacI/PurR family transcriptional regulator
MSKKMPILDGRTLSEKTAQELEQIIRSEMKPGDRLLPEPELAEKLGVSRGTIRNALTILENDSLISRHKKRGTIVTGRESLRSVALYFPGIGDKFLEMAFSKPIFTGITTQAFDLSIDVILKGSWVNMGKGRTAGVIDVTNIPWDSFDAIIVYEEFNKETLEKLGVYKHKVVVIDHDATPYGITSVVYNNREGGRLAARKLIDAGHTKLGFIGEITNHGQGVDPAFVERFEGFSSEILKKGLVIDNDAVFDLSRHHFQERSVIKKIADTFSKKGITGVFDLTHSVSNALKDEVEPKGTSVPLSAIRIKTIDSVMPETSDQSYVCYDGHEMGILSVKALHALSTGKEGPGLLKTIEPEFIESIHGL